MAQTGGLLQKLKARAETALKGQREAMKIFAAQTVPSLQQTQGLLQLIRKDAQANIMTDQVMLDSAQGTRFQVSLISVITVVVGILLAFLMIRGINAVLLRITNELGQGASQVASASTQVSSASQSLAEGAAQQAAQLEETSASVEEMASMTRQNADSAQQANSLMDEAGKIVGEANTSMKHLKEAWVFCALWWKGIGRQQTVREISNSSNLPKRKWAGNSFPGRQKNKTPRSWRKILKIKSPWEMISRTSSKDSGRAAMGRPSLLSSLSSLGRVGYEQDSARTGGLHIGC